MELIISISNFGFLFLIPAGILSEKIGTRWTTIFGVVMLVSGYLMLWSTTFEIDYYSDRAVLMMLLFFITGKWSINIHIYISRSISYGLVHCFVGTSFRSWVLSNTFVSL